MLYRVRLQVHMPRSAASLCWLEVGGCEQHVQLQWHHLQGF